MKKILTALLFSAAASFNTLAQTITVDNEDPDFSIVEGNWTPSSFISGFLGRDYLNTGDTATFSEVQWQLDTTSGDEYTVSARWTAFGNRTSSATYTITHANGISTVNVDQRTNGGEFFSLGTFVNPTLVQLTNEGIDGFVVADAIRVEKIIPEGSFEGILHTDLGFNFQLNTVYQAPSDGIITYRNDGPCTGNVDLMIIGSDEQFTRAVSTSRADNSSGMTSPVKAGMHWTVQRNRSGSECRARIGFFPLGTSFTPPVPDNSEQDLFEGIIHNDLGDNLRLNTAYKAEFDGIITYRNDGPCTGNVDLMVVGIDQQFSQAVSTSRADNSSGMTSPIKEGMYWIVQRNRSGSECRVRLGFFPLD